MNRFARFAGAGLLAALLCFGLAATLHPDEPASPATEAADDLAVLSPVETRTPTGVRYEFAQDIDAVSFRMPDRSLDARVRAWTGERWTPWERLEIEFEFDPLLTESNLVMFPTGVRIIELASAKPLPMHPIRVSHEPVAYQTASHFLTRKPRILARSEWGADEAILVKGPETSRSDTHANGGEDKENAPAPSPSAKRVIDCKQMQRDYPNEFKGVKTVRTNDDGQKYRWAQQYSPSIELLVVHHTALQVAGDPRPPVERMRALYAYHSNGRGWGDIGYNFVIDEKGQVYEGRAGGSRVVAGHAYCHNIGTLGIALLGNFELEKPTQDQISALQWLLHSLAITENINPAGKVTFHGNTTPTIVGHGDLVSTTCPGFFLRDTLDQVRANVVAGKMYAHVNFPSLKKNYKDNTKGRRAQRMTNRPTAPAVEEGVTPRGAMLLRGRPGTQAILSVRYQAGEQAKTKGAVVAQAKVPDGVGLWQDLGTGFDRVRDRIELPEPVPARGTTMLRLKVQFPHLNGRSTLSIGGITYIIETEGRLGRAAQTTPEIPSSNAPVRERPRLLGRSALADDGPTIRIRLSYPDATGTIAAPPGALVNNRSVERGELSFERDDDNCVVSEDGMILGAGIVRIDTREGVSAIASWTKAANRFRGIIECRVVDGQLALINELPLEQYLRGLAEEPDTEPYEKQRAFAIAARSYAAYYMHAEGSNRKFPGKPYDGSDDPAVFQKYSGVDFEEKNPNWLKAVDTTQLMVLTVDGTAIKVPYFSQSSGRTLSPREAGWPNFPHAEIFKSKDDHWCVGMKQAGHGVGMSGCGAEAQANEGKSAEQILEYYYPGARRERLQ